MQVRLRHKDTMHIFRQHLPNERPSGSNDLARANTANLLEPIPNGIPSDAYYQDEKNGKDQTTATATRWLGNDISIFISQWRTIVSNKVRPVVYFDSHDFYRVMNWETEAILPCPKKYMPLRATAIQVRRKLSASRRFPSTKFCWAR